MTPEDLQAKKDSMMDFHKHELMDRLAVMHLSFQSMIQRHPAAILCRKEIDHTERMLALLYRVAAQQRFGENLEQDASSGTHYRPAEKKKS